MEFICILYLSIDTPIYNGLSLERLLNIAKTSLVRSAIDEGFYVFYDVPGELKSLLSFMEKNHLSDAIVSSRTKSGIKRLDRMSLTFIPSALYAYLLGYRTIAQRK